MNFDIQYTTFVSYLNFFMNCGIIFESDGLDESQVKRIEECIILEAYRRIDKGTFTNEKPNKLAALIIKKTR